MKLTISAEEMAQLVEGAKLISVKGFDVMDVNWKSYNDLFEVVLEKSNVAQTPEPVATGNSLGRRPPPTPSTPPFVPKYDPDRDNPRHDPLVE